MAPSPEQTRAPATHHHDAAAPPLWRDARLVALTGTALALAGLACWFAVLIWPGAPPRSGPNCTGTGTACIAYPYTDAVDHVPGDFLWMVPAFLLGPLLVLLLATLSPGTPPRRPLARAGLVFAGVSATVLMLDYYVQLTTVQTSLLRGELDGGLSLLSQYNPHGMFVALEDVGYFAMSLALLTTGIALTPTGPAGRALRATMVIGGGLGVTGIVVLPVLLRGDLEYFYEIYSLSVCWIALVVIGVLAALTTRRPGTQA